MLAEADRRATALETANADLLHEMHERRVAECFESGRSTQGRVSCHACARAAHSLAPIRNGLQIMRMTNDLETIGRAQIKMERLQQMVRLVDDLLDVSRITTGKLVLRTERVSQDVMTMASPIKSWPKCVRLPRGARHPASLQACVNTRIRLSRFKSSASGLKRPIF